MDNKLSEMEIAQLSSQELEKLRDFEKSINQFHGQDELYIIALKR